VAETGALPPQFEKILIRLAQCASAPLLEDLTISQCHCQDYRPDSPLVSFHGNAPRLENVILDDVVVDWSLFHDLVELNLMAALGDVQAMLGRLLRESPRLTDPSLKYSGPAEPFTDWQDDPIEQPSLETFSIMYYDSRYVSALFRRLSMPNLKKLSLELHGANADYSEFITASICSFRTPASQNQRLACGDDLSAINVMHEQLTNFKSINLNCFEIDSLFFTTLMEPSFGTLYGPHLKAIIIAGIPGQLMRSFVEALVTL
jgi:hypothetical protein